VRARGCCTAGLQSDLCPLWVMCGRRLIDKSFFEHDAALVGCGHVSGLLMRHGWPLALMLCADQVPIQSTHSEMRSPKWVLLLVGTTVSALRRCSLANSL